MLYRTLCTSVVQTPATAFPGFLPSCKAEEERVALTHAGPGRAEHIADSSISSAEGKRIFPLPKTDSPGRGKRFSSFCFVGTALITPPCEERLLGFVHT